MFVNGKTFIVNSLIRPLVPHNVVVSLLPTISILGSEQFLFSGFIYGFRKSNLWFSDVCRTLIHIRSLAGGELPEVQCLRLNELEINLIHLMSLVGYRVVGPSSFKFRRSLPLFLSL